MWGAGIRGTAIATELNIRNNLGTKDRPNLNRQNIENFVDSVPSNVLAISQRKHDDDIYSSTREELMDHIHKLQEDLFPRLMTEINMGAQGDVNRLRVLGSIYTKVFDRVSKLEGLAGTEKIMRAEHKDVILQLQRVMDFFKTVNTKVCPDCQIIMLDEAKKQKTILITRDIRSVSKP